MDEAIFTNIWIKLCTVHMSQVDSVSAEKTAWFIFTKILGYINQANFRLYIELKTIVLSQKY